jgi:signal transduction histidine kinase
MPFDPAAEAVLPDAAARRMLQQSEKMAAIGQLVASVAHEINNPIGFVHSNLGSLDGYVDDLLRVIDAYDRAADQSRAAPQRLEEVAALRRRLDVDFLRDDVRALLAETREGIGRVRRIVQDLKDLSRPGGDDEWQWADLRRGLEATLNIVGCQIRYDVQIVRDYAELPEIECLPAQLNQVFLNLLVNAAQAIEKQGSITVRTAADATSVRIEIADNGCGIPPERLPRLFEPFYTTKPAGRGTGLGLALSRDIVHKHGGRIEVESAVGQGTTFRVILPCQRAAQAA